MKFQYASDLHLEFPKNYEFLQKNPMIPSGDILLLAGDIVPIHLIDRYRDFFKFCSDNFEFTYWIPGNHEYYGGNLSGRISRFTETIESNVKLLNNTWIQHGNTRLIFSTLWTPISEEKAWYVQNGLNDYRVIKDGEQLFTTSRSTYLFQENLAFIQEAAKENQQERSIVVTHHVPTLQHYPEEYRNSNINEAFATDLDDYIMDSNIDYWIYGHHHRNVPAFKIGTTELLTNQLGYVNYHEHHEFSFNKVIEAK